MGDPLVYFRPYFSILTVLSCSCSAVTASLSVLYWMRGCRSVLSKQILLFIAVADLVTACGYIAGSALYLSVHDETGANASDFEDGSSIAVADLTSIQPFYNLCKGQSFVTTTGNLWSFWWTCILAIHLCNCASNRLQLSRRCLPFYICVGWLVPLVLTVPLLATDWLGPGNGSVSVTWCYITLRSNGTDRDYTYDILELVSGKMWEMTSILVIFICFVYLKCTLRRKVGAHIYSPA